MLDRAGRTWGRGCINSAAWAVWLEEATRELRGSRAAVDKKSGCDDEKTASAAGRSEARCRPCGAQLGVEGVVAVAQAAIGGLGHMVGDPGIGGGTRDRAEDAEATERAR